MSSLHYTPKPNSTDAPTASPEGTKAWGGVFTEFTDRRVELFTESISIDKRLYEADIRGSIAHAKMLRDVLLVKPLGVAVILTIYAVLF